jgi:hypothetical protein
VAQDRLRRLADGRIVLKLKTAWADGTRYLETSSSMAGIGRMGAVINVLVPVHPLAPRAAFAYTAPTRRPGGPMGNTVLVVDDRPDARYSMAHPLATAGFDVRESATGRDALRLACAFRSIVTTQIGAS